MQSSPVAVDWQPPTDLVVGCRQAGNTTFWRCDGLGPRMVHSEPHSPPPHNPYVGLVTVPGDLRLAAGYIEHSQRSGNPLEVKAAIRAIRTALDKIDESIRRNE
jgi:hypothetical protein